MYLLKNVLLILKMLLGLIAIKPLTAFCLYYLGSHVKMVCIKCHNAPGSATSYLF